MSATRVEFPEGPLIDGVEAAAEAVRRYRHQLLEKIGVQILSFVKLDYVAKSRGGTGTDGIKWRPITVATILARLRKAGHLKSKPIKGSKIPAGVPVSARQRSVRVVAKSVKANEALFRELAKAGVKFRDKKTGRVIKGGQARAKAGTYIGVSQKTAKRTVNISPGSYQIGVNTGLQLNSASPGYQAPDGKGGNVTDYTESSVTVGFGRSYSGHFDKHRKLIPDTLPDPWRQTLEEMVSHVNGKIVEDALKQKGGS